MGVVTKNKSNRDSEESPSSNSGSSSICSGSSGSENTTDSISRIPSSLTSTRSSNTSRILSSKRNSCSSYFTASGKAISVNLDDNNYRLCDENTEDDVNESAFLQTSSPLTPRSSESTETQDSSYTSTSSLYTTETVKLPNAQKQMRAPEPAVVQKEKLGIERTTQDCLQQQKSMELQFTEQKIEQDHNRPERMYYPPIANDERKIYSVQKAPNPTKVTLVELFKKAKSIKKKKGKKTKGSSKKIKIEEDDSRSTSLKFDEPEPEPGSLSPDISPDRNFACNCMENTEKFAQQIERVKMPLGQTCPCFMILNSLGEYPGGGPILQTNRPDRFPTENEKNTENVESILENAAPKAMPPELLILKDNCKLDDKLQKIKDDYEKHNAEVARLLRKYYIETRWEKEHESERLLVKFTNLKVELEAQQNNIRRVTMEKFALLNKLRDVNNFKKTLCIGMAALFCKLTCQEDLLNFFLQENRCLPLFRIINIYFMDFVTRSIKDPRMLQSRTNESKAMIALLCMLVNITRSNEGRLVFMANSDARQLTLNILKALPILPKYKSDSVKKILLTLLYNLCICPAGLISLQIQPAILNEVHDFILTEVDYEKKMLGLRFMDLLTKRIINWTALRKIEPYIPYDVLYDDLFEEDFPEIYNLAISIIYNVRRAMVQLDIYDKMIKGKNKRSIPLEECAFYDGTESVD